MRTSAAVVRDADGIVTNVIIVDDEALPSVPVDHTLVALGDGMAIDGTYDPAAKTFAPSPVPPEQPLPEVKADATVRIDAAAEAARGQWITKGDGQMLVYQAKRLEAEAWARAGSPRAMAGYSFMRSRAARLNRVQDSAVTEAQMQAVAAEWRARAADWREVGSAIEAVREQAKEDIAAATDAEAVDSVLAGLTWPR